MEIYCLKCKSKTSTLDLIESITKNKHKSENKDYKIKKRIRHKKDKNTLKKINKLKNLNFKEKLNKAMIKQKINTKYKLGLGILKKKKFEEAKALHKPIIKKFKR